MENDFYNQEQKERYIALREIKYQDIRKICRVLFKATRVNEEKLNKDCSNFTTLEILNMYSSFTTRSWEHLLNINSQLKIYTRWCIKESLVFDNQNHYEELDKYDMYKCLNLGLKESMIITRAELESKIREFPNPSEQFLALAFFEGLGGLGYKDFNNLMPEQFVGNKVILSDRELEVSNLLIERAFDSANEYDKYSFEGKKRSGYLKTDPSVVKASCNSTVSDSSDKTIRTIQRRIMAMEKEYGKAYGYVGLKTSGRIDMIKRFMKEDKSDDIRQTYNNHKKEIEYRYGKLQRVHRWIEENQQFFAEDKGSN